MANGDKIQVIDFLKEVESNRRSLIANAQSKGKIIDNTASLTQAVAINNTIEPSTSPEKIEVRFFDADGTLLQQSFIDYGGSVIPPPNPSYDSERLIFDRWASAIGERFDNLTHDIDYGATYKIKDRSYHLFCTFNDTTGYTVTLSPYQNVAHTITIDWGDGTENDTKTNTGTTQISHTYTQAGNYEIIMSSDTEFNYPTYQFYFSSYLLATSQNQSISIALNKAYMLIIYQNEFSANQEYIDVVISEMTNGSTFNGIKNIILQKNTMSGLTNIKGNVLKTLILDNSLTRSCSYSSFCGEIDKLIIPSTLSNNSLPSVSSGDAMNIKKIITLNNHAFGNASMTSVKSLQILNSDVNILPQLDSMYSLEEYIIPDSIVSISTNGYIASNSKLKVFKVPISCKIQSNSFRNMYALENLILYNNFDYSFRLYSSNITNNCLVDMLNKIKDNSGLTTKTITINQDLLHIKMLKIYVVLNNGLWELSSIGTPNAITIIEAFNNKNWTITS